MMDTEIARVQMRALEGVLVGQVADLVRLRFIEAADTDWRLPTERGPSEKSGDWPRYMHDFADMAGWGDKRLQEYRTDIWSRTSRPDANAISRRDEVMDWTRCFIADEERRRMVWVWAFCVAVGGEFSAYCRKNDVAHRTAYDRLHKLFQRVAVTLCNKRVLLRDVDENRVAHIGLNKASLNGILRKDASSPAAWISENAKPVSSDVDPDFSWAEEQNERRRRREARRRKLKLLGAA